MTDAEIADLKTIRTNHVTRLKELSTSPKPTYNVEGTSYSWQQYQEFLTKSIENLNRIISENDDSDPVVEESSINYPM